MVFCSFPSFEGKELSKDINKTAELPYEKFGKAWSFLIQAYELFLYVTNVLFFGRIKEKVADGSNEGIDTESNVTENEVSPASGGVTFGLEAGVVDDDATDPTKEESEQETNYFVGINGVYYIVVGVVVHVRDLLS